ncbi:hypothetical protein TruAng_003804 [Truncatella angustata]|nr:hypothetical protein TruAng_003804 [Truncatella angustata]
MPTYVITGTSKGLGYEFLRQLSSDAKNKVIGIVRDKQATEKRVAEELHGRMNIHIIQADITNYENLENAVAQVADISGGSVDYLIANAAYMSQVEAERFGGFAALSKQPQVLQEDLSRCLNTNVIAQINLINLFMPLIFKGQVKKVIAISSGHSDLDLITKYNIEFAPLYTISKAALNAVIAKFSAQYSEDGVLFLSVCPGMVDTGSIAELTEVETKALTRMLGKFQEYAPHFKGPATPEAAIKDVLSVIERSSVESGNGGSFLSHLGTKQWL